MLKRIDLGSTSTKLCRTGKVFNTLKLVKEVGGRIKKKDIPGKDYSTLFIVKCEVLGFLKRIETFPKKNRYGGLTKEEYKIQIALGTIKPAKALRVDYKLTETGQKALEILENSKTSFAEVPVKVDPVRYAHYKHLIER